MDDLQIIEEYLKEQDIPYQLTFTAARGRHGIVVCVKVKRAVVIIEGSLFVVGEGIGSAGGRSRSEVFIDICNPNSFQMMVDAVNRINNG